MPAAQESYASLVETLRALGAALGPAVAVQHEPSPRTREAAESAHGVPNPTLDTILDPRRQAVSDEVARAERSLRQARTLLEPRVPALHGAIARWEGREKGDPSPR